MITAKVKPISRSPLIISGRASAVLRIFGVVQQHDDAVLPWAWRSVLSIKVRADLATGAASPGKHSSHNIDNCRPKAFRHMIWSSENGAAGEPEKIRG